jgi:hydrogenase nickel incorporation protein HypA/HybF
MHELGIAQGIIDRVAREMLRHPGGHARAVGVKVGEISSVDPDALSFGFEALVKDTEWQRLVLEIDYCVRRHRCPDCGTEFNVSDFETSCIACGNAATVMISGDELDIGYIEVDDK